MKRITGVLALFIALLCFAGCGNDSAQKDDMTKEVELVWYTGDAPQKDLALVNEAINKYTKEKINATVKIVQIPFSEIEKKTNLAITSGEQVDVVFSCNWANDYRQLGPKGMFLPLDGLLKEYGGKLNEIIIPDLWKTAKVGGNTYVVPINKDIGYQQALIMNKSIADKYSVNTAAVKTLQDLEPAFARIHAAAPGIDCLRAAPSHGMYYKYDFLFDEFFPGAVKLDDTTCKVINQLEQADFIENYAYYHRLYEKGYISKNAGVSGGERPFKEGKTFAGIEGYGPGVEVTVGKRMGMELAACALDNPVITTSTCAMGLAIPSTSKNPERAMKFLELLNTDVYLRNLVNYGIEGTHYQKLSNGQIHLLPRSNDYIVPGPGMGNLFILYVPDSQPANLWDLYKKQNEIAKRSPLLGFTFNTEPVKTEISALNNIVQEFYVPISTGSVAATESFAKFNAKLKAAGLDKVLAEMQKQVDEWKKNQ